MEQRPLRLGDIVDDYCPRERRITNHVIVAIVEEAIRQTRCSTCDAEHVYKDGREPKRRRKEPTPVVAAAAADSPGSARPAAVPRVAAAETDRAPTPAPEVAPSAEDGVAVESPVTADEAWPAHRPLIRATLPRTEGDPPAPRPIPEFTMHQRQGRGQGFRFAQGWNGNAPDRGNGFRPNRPAHGTGRDGNSLGNSQGHGNGRPSGGGRRRRSRHKPPR